MNKKRLLVKVIIVLAILFVYSSFAQVMTPLMLSGSQFTDQPSNNMNHALVRLMTDGSLLLFIVGIILIFLKEIKYFIKKIKSENKEEN